MTVLKSILKIKLNEKDVFLVCSFELQKKLRIFILDINNNEAFSGIATDVDLRSQAANIRMSFSDFIALTTKALTQNESNTEQFIYSMEKNYEDFTFKWKSVDSDETIISIGCVKLNKNDDGSVMKDVFSMLSEELLNLNKKMLNIETKLSNAENDKAEALNLLSEATNIKESFEKELYAKFVLVLNEKKKKIKDLKQTIDSKFPKRANVTNSKPIKKSRFLHHQISDSSDEIDSNLDDLNEPGPSNSKSNNSVLFFDDDEPKLPTTPSKIRNRTNKGTVKPSNFPLFKFSAKETSEQKDSESEDDLLNNL